MTDPEKIIQNLQEQVALLEEARNEWRDAARKAEVERDNLQSERLSMEMQIALLKRVLLPARNALAGFTVLVDKGLVSHPESFKKVAEAIFRAHGHVSAAFSAVMRNDIESLQKQLGIEPDEPEGPPAEKTEPAAGSGDNVIPLRKPI